jgi:hypothetical protein
LKIPVKYDNVDIGQVIEFDEETGKITAELDMDKDGARLIKEMIMHRVPISMSCKHEPSEPSEESK